MRAGPTHSPDYPWLMAAAVVVCAAGAGSAIWPVVEHALTVALIAVPLVAVAAWAWRREVPDPVPARRHHRQHRPLRHRSSRRWSSRP